MLIDASQNEETRVAISENGTLHDFDIESLVRKQIKGNIYLAKVTRVEPSLQAAFVNYGGNRHGFLPFSEIHPDYYRIPVADRERLMAEQAELEKQAAEEAERIAAEEDAKAEKEASETESQKETDENIEEIDSDETVIEAGSEAENDQEENTEENAEIEAKDDNDSSQDQIDTESNDTNDEESTDTEKNTNEKRGRGGRGRYRRNRNNRGKKYAASNRKDDRISDDDDELSTVEPFWKRIRRAYKIQEVIKRGQIMLIQVNKEERGNKGAAVTSYITLPGRYCVLMPNSPQSGGVSRKIANFKDRKRMREILKDLSIPEGMSVILRTAGTSRTKAEIKRDLDYLMRLWNNIRELTLQSSAPAVVNEEGSLIKRAIRDLYTKDIDEVLVSGENGYKSARNMMKMLMPSHMKKVKHYKNETPLFIKENVETQIEEMHSPTVQLKSGGYLVINPTEALVSIDVNSGRATKERNIEDTALRTNLEAAKEVARQLKLRDLGGLVVIDFIDMEKRSFNNKVEKAMRDALASDRARIQIGRISSFGLMEMSRQRLQPSLTETHFETCPHCHGMGIVKTVDTVALAILRAIEESGMKKQNSNITITVDNDVALYLFNHRRQSISELENRYNISIIAEIGKVEDESRFSLASVKKPVEKSNDTDNTLIEDDDIDTLEDETAPKQENKSKSQKQSRRKPKKSENAKQDDQSVAETQSPESENEPQDKDKKPNRKRKKPARKVEITDTNTDNNASNTDKDIDSKKVDNETPTTPEKSEKKPRKPSIRTRKKTTESEEIKTSVDNPESQTTPSPAINDNGSKNTAVADSETLNKTPEKKKKGWWNKIIDNE